MLIEDDDGSLHSQRPIFRRVQIGPSGASRTDRDLNYLV
jgi:hypothetical protein